MADEEDEKATRKEEEGDLEKTICLSFYSDVSPKRAALCQFKIRTSGDGSRLVEADDEQVLRLIATFFDENYERRIGMVGCVTSGSSGCFYLIPSEIDEEDAQGPLSGIDRSRILPRKFNLLDLKTDSIPCPQTRKVFPITMAVHDKVYVLSRRTPTFSSICEPSFESFDPRTGSWERLARPRFNNKTPYFWDWYATGYVILDNFILVCLTQVSTDRTAFFSYNVSSRKWKMVCMVKDAVHSNWDGEAVVVDGIIYGYSSYFRQLISLSFSVEEERENVSYDLSVELGTVIFGFTMDHPPHGDFDSESAAIGKIGARMLCVAHTSIPVGRATQFVRISIIDIEECNNCTVLKSFTCTLPDEEQFYAARISSCLVLQPEVFSSMENSGRDRKKYNDAVALASEVGMWESSMTMDVAEVYDD